MCLAALFVTALVRPPVISAFPTKVFGTLGRTAAGVALYATGKQTPSSFSSVLGDMASSLFGGEGSKSLMALNAELDQKMESMTPSWETVRSKLESLQTEEERVFRDNLKLGYGVASPLHKVRLYDPKTSNSVDAIRVTFYRDSASWCPYCQKVWIALEYKQIPYAVEKINMRCYGDKPLSFQTMQPSGQIPVAIVDGRVLRQSNDILSTLESDFPESPKSLAPPPGLERKAQELLRLERQLFSAWMTWLTSGGDGDRLQERFIQELTLVEQALKSIEGPFFLGDSMSIVDVQFAPFLERMAASLLYYKGFTMRVPPNHHPATEFSALNRWFDAMEELPSYQLTKSDYYTHCWDLPPQMGGCVQDPKGALYARVINGEDSLSNKDDAAPRRGSWELPLQPHNGGVEPDWSWAGDDAVARREAVERLSFNNAAIVAFAARGAGRRGMPPVSAPLADPNATSNAAVQASVDSVLRMICAVMLEGTESSNPTASEKAEMESLSAAIVNEGGIDFADDVVNSLAYLRDRVGVPRDMKLPAARLVRAHLNWSIAILLNNIDAVRSKK